MEHPCENLFRKLASEDFGRLKRYIVSDKLDIGQMSIALEMVGINTDSNQVRELLIPMLDNQNPIIQESAIYGLLYHIDYKVIEKLKNMLENPSLSPGVRIAANDALDCD